MTNIDIYPMQDNYETTLARSRDGAIGAVYVNTVPGITFPSGKTTYITINPGKSNQQVAIINAIDISLKTVTVSSISVDKSPGVAYSQETHAVGSIVRISNNYEARQNVVDAVDSKLDSIGGEAASFDLTITGSNWRVRKDGSDMKLTDDNQSEITLSTLASGGGADEKVKISVNDTTAGYLNGKLTGGDGITLTETNDGSNETLDIDVDITDTTTFVTTKTASKVPVLNGSGEIDTFLSSAIPLVASDAEAQIGTDDAKFITSLVLRNYFNAGPGEGIFSSSDSGVDTNSTSVVKLRETTVLYTGTYTVEFTFSETGSGNPQGQIYVNGSAVGIYQTAVGTYNEDIDVNAGDNIQIYAKNTVGGANITTVSNFRIKGCLVPKTGGTIVL